MKLLCFYLLCMTCICAENCKRIGECTSCELAEEKEEYCKETGYKQELLCDKEEEGRSTIEFESCVRQRVNTAWSVFVFEFFMVALFLTVYFLLQKEKKRKTRYTTEEKTTTSIQESNDNGISQTSTLLR